MLQEIVFDDKFLDNIESTKIEKMRPLIHEWRVQDKVN